MSDLSRLDAIAESERVYQTCELGACHFYPTMNRPIADIQDRIQFYVPSDTIALSDPMPLVPDRQLRLTEWDYFGYLGHRVAFSSADSVVVESFTTQRKIGGQWNRIISFAFYDARGQPSLVNQNRSHQHPDAKHTHLRIKIRAFAGPSSICLYQIRLHPGGLLSALFAEPRRNLDEYGLPVPARCETHLMVIDWHKGVILGVSNDLVSAKGLYADIGKDV
jgi:hypothetical protein